MNEARRAGKTAFITGWILMVPATVPTLLQREALKRGAGAPLLLLPILGLLALYLIVAGGLQWRTGLGGIRGNQGRSLGRFAVAVFVATLVITALFGWASATP